MVADFAIGKTYNRRRDIHDRFGGQRQSGIVTPSKAPIIFIFTGRGRRHGYNDEWSTDGTFRYFGEGQSGHMTLTKGNKAIANHAADGKELLLFEMLRAGQARFRGPFDCAGYSVEDGRDQESNPRKVIVFHLVPLGDETEEEETPAPPVAGNSLAELRKKALAAAGPARQGEVGNTRRTYRIRSNTIREYVLARAGGICESCDHPAPFKTAAGAPYLEPHHIRRLTDGGPDDARFMGGICPNCHRDIHHGAQGHDRNVALQGKITAKENELAGKA